MNAEQISELTEACSPYKFGKKLGVKPQMIYNYCSKPRKDGSFRITAYAVDGKLLVSADEQQRFATAYFNKKQAQTADADVQQTEVAEALK